MLDAIRVYLDTKVHPKVIHQLEIWRAKQSDGSSEAESMRRQVCQFYDTNMEDNTIEDWLKLLLYTTCQDKELLSKVLAIHCSREALSAFTHHPDSFSVTAASGRMA